MELTNPKELISIKKVFKSFSHRTFRLHFWLQDYLPCDGRLYIYVAVLCVHWMKLSRSRTFPPLHAPLPQVRLLSKLWNQLIYLPLLKIWTPQMVATVESPMFYCLSICWNFKYSKGWKRSEQSFLYKNLSRKIGFILLSRYRRQKSSIVKHIRSWHL